MVYTCAIFSGFNCSMETSRIIRVGARNYVIRIAASSQEHVLACITRKVTRPEDDMVLMLASKFTRSCVRGRNRRDFSVGDRNWLDFSVGIIIDLVRCGGRKWLVLESGSKLTWFSCRGHAKLAVFRVGIDISLNSVLGSKLTWFCVGDISWLGFSVSTENDMFLWGGQHWPCFCVRVENYLFIVWAWKLTWFW